MNKTTKPVKGFSSNKHSTGKTISEAKQIGILSKASPELLKITGKHSTLWNYSKMETVEKIVDLIQSGQEQTLKEVKQLLPYGAGFTDRFNQLLKQRKE